MARIARAVAAHHPHLVTQHGYEGEPVFSDRSDYIHYVLWLRKYSRKYGLDVLAYCLLDDHVQLLCIPHSREALSKTFNALHMRYANYYNARMNRQGHLWQGRFHSCILDKNHTLAAIRYIETAPVRSGRARTPFEYEWSSARGHLDRDADFITTPETFIEEQAGDWIRFLAQPQSSRAVHELKSSVMTGRPCGTPDFVHEMESMLGRKLTVKPRGRPRKIRPAAR